MTHRFSTPPQCPGRPNLTPSPCKLATEVDEESLWRDAMSCLPFSEGGSDSDDDECVPRRHGAAALARLPTGELHACRLGVHCPFLIPNDDRIMVCMYTGVEHGPEHADEHFDLNGGSGRKTGDPDVNCGEPANGKWVKRVDPVQASRHAFEASKQLCDEDTFPTAPPELTELGRKSHKRNARCVGDETVESETKKHRAGKKNTQSMEVRTNLTSEAEKVILKMIDHKRAFSYKQKAPDGKSDRKCAKVDPRMQDELFVFNSALKRYIKKCVSESAPPSLDTVHNLSLMAKTVSAKARQAGEEALATDAVRTAKFRTSCSALIVALWSAVCATPYMKNAKRGTDAYRPFVCGALYAFKRGLSLPSGTVLLPPCPQLALALPVLRGTGGNAVARTLHSSSHRGMCTMSRCIASVPTAEQSAFFANVARIASQFSAHRFSKWDV